MQQEEKQMTLFDQDTWSGKMSPEPSALTKADDQKEAEYLGHEAGRVKHQECDEIEVVGVMPVTSNLNAGKRRLCWRIPLKGRALKFVKEAIKNGRKKAH